MKVAVIGAGWAGLAAASELAAAGMAVDVFEASRTLGGRARAVEWTGRAVDNGQHIMIGAYTETLRLMRMVGANPERLLRRIPLRLEFPGEFLLAAPRLPAPLHLLCALAFARGLGWREKWHAINLMRRLRRANYQVDPALTVADWLETQQSPYRQRRLLWEPLCIAALNTPVTDASAQLLANVLRDSLGGTRDASDLLLPVTDMTSVFPEAAAQFVVGHQGRILQPHRVQSLQREAAGWRVDAGECYAHVVLAVAPYHLPALLPELMLPVFEWEPIVTVYLQYAAHLRLPSAMLGVSDGMAQWVFDRGTLCGQNGLLAAVISARGRHLQLSAEDLQARVAEEIRRIAPAFDVVHDALTITEKRATFAARPGLARPASEQGMGLWLAGDYVAGDCVAAAYPATLEGAVRSGVAAAEGIKRSFRQGGHLP